MVETGWPLIPRDALPAAAPVVAKGVRRVPASHPDASHPDAGRQLPIFGAETTEPSPLDLAGLLAGPGRLGRMGGTARVSVRVDAAWRVHVLVAELVARGLVVTWRPIDDPDREVRGGASPPESGVPAATVDEDVNPAQDHSPVAEPEGRRIGAATEEEPAAAEPDGREPDGRQPDGRQPEPDGAEPTDRAGDEGTRADGTVTGAGSAEVSAEQVAPLPAFEVRTAYSSRLNALARAWPAAAEQLFLSGPRLRLWVAAAGRPVDGGYALGLGVDDSGISVDVALRRAGLDGALSDHGLHYLISGRKPLHRLAELVGERPAAAPAEVWPGDAGA